MNNTHLKLEAVTNQVPTMTMACQVCNAITRHLIEHGKTKTVYTCMVCGRESVRQGALA